MGAPVCKVGDLLVQKYRVTHILGQGGMGMVVAAHHEILDQRVALKFILPEALSADGRERFMREARASAKLQSEHVARVSDVGMLENHAPYLVMEHLEGEDLAQVIERQGPVRQELVADYILQALDALAEAHSLGIVHRDVKPANLFLARRTGGNPVIKVLDFGIAKSTTDAHGASSVALTKTASVMGSPLYMSPEQVRSAKKVDARSDLWAVGVIMYELLTGKPPFGGDNVGEVFAKILEDAPPSISTGATRPDVSPALEAIVMRLLQRDPNARFQSAGELAQALMPFGTGFATNAARRAMSLSKMRPPEPPRSSSPELAQTVPHLVPTDAPWVGVTPRTTAPKPSTNAAVVMAVVALLVISALATGVVLFMRRPRTSPTFGAVSAPVALATATESAPPAETAKTEDKPAASEPAISADAAAPAPSSSASARPRPPAKPKKDIWER